MRRAALAGILGLAPASTAFALDPAKALTQYVLETWGLREGLPTSHVRRIVQARDGYLWLGTTQGLVRFDGARFVTFSPQDTPALGNGLIWALLAARGGDLWIGTYGGGLARHRGRQWDVFREASGLADDIVLKLLEDRRGDLWIATRDGGVQRWSAGKLWSYAEVDGLRTTAAEVLNEDRQGHVWIAVHGGLLRWDGQAMRSYTRRDGLRCREPKALQEDRDGTLWIGSHDAGLEYLRSSGQVGRLAALTAASVERLHLDRQGRLWIASDKGLHSLESGALRRRLDALSTPGQGVASLLDDGDGNLWVGTQLGLWRVQDENVALLTEADGLGSNFVGPLLEDADGSLWVGTTFGGVSRLKDGPFTPWKQRPGSRGVAAHAVLEDRDGEIWTGGSGGLFLLRDHRLGGFAKAEGLPSSYVRTMFQDRAGTLWVGTERGLARFSGGRFHSLAGRLGLGRAPVLACAQDPEGRLWIGTEEGLYSSARPGLEPWRKQPGLANPVIRRLRVAVAGGLWVTTDGGLHYLRGAHRADYGRKEGLPHLVLRGLHEDVDGTVWVGTVGAGLLRLRNGKVSVLSSRDGLLDDFVHEILDDGIGSLWLIGDRGVSRLARSDIEAYFGGSADRLRPEAFDESDGLPSRECSSRSQHSAIRARDGRLWVATSRGLASIDPRRRPRRPPPAVEIETVSIDRRPADVGGSLELPPGTPDVEIHYSAASLLSPHKTRFRYRLEGLDRGWVEAGARRAAYYTSLPPGQYVFQVAASFDERAWSETPAALSLRIAPFFHQTAWFWCLLAFAIVGLLWLVHSSRLRQVDARHAAVLSERTRIAHEVHDTIAQGISALSLQLEGAVETLRHAPETAMSHLDLGRQIARQTLSDSRRLIANLRPERLERHGLAGALNQTALEVATGGPTEIRCEVRGAERPLSPLVEAQMLQIGREAIANATRHGRASRVEVELSYEPERLRLRVHDDGVGFDPARVAGGGHFGVRGMRERVAECGGGIEIESAPGRGAEVRVWLPAE